MEVEEQQRGLCWKSLSLSLSASRAKESVRRFLCAGEMWAGGLVGALTPFRTSSRSPLRTQEIVCCRMMLNISVGLSSIVRRLHIPCDKTHLWSGFFITSTRWHCQSLIHCRPLSPYPQPMASFVQSLPVCSAVRKQSTTAPLFLNASQIFASSRTCSSFYTLSSQSRLISSRKSPPNPLIPCHLSVSEL